MRRGPSWPRCERPPGRRRERKEPPPYRETETEATGEPADPAPDVTRRPPRVDPGVLAETLRAMTSTAIVLGATLAIAMRRALPLTVYILAFVPAIVNIMLIASGRQMIAGNSPVSGFLVLWGGNAVLAVALWLAWRRVARN